MDNFIDVKVREAALHKSEANFDVAIGRFNAAQSETKEAHIAFYEKMAFYSAGIISLSITFLGYVISKNQTTIWVSLAGIPLAYLIFTSWVLFACCLLIGIFYRRIWSDFLFYTSYKEYLEAQKTNCEERVSFQEHYPGHILSTHGKTREELIAIERENVQIVSEKLKKIEGKETKYGRLGDVIGVVCTACFSGGMVLMITFIIAVVIKL